LGGARTSGSMCGASQYPKMLFHRIVGSVAVSLKALLCPIPCEAVHVGIGGPVYHR